MTFSLSTLSRAICILSLALVALTALPPAPVAGQTPTQSPDLDQLLDELTGDDLLAAERAAQQLAVVGTAGLVPQLSEIFRSADTPRLAAIALGGIGTQQATRTLAGALVDDDLTARRNAAQIGLLYGGEQAVQTLLATLRFPQPAARRNAAELLGYLGDPVAVNSLLRVANHDVVPSVRQSAVWALSEIDSPRVLLALTEISVQDPDSEVRAEAERALQRLNAPFRQP